MLLHWHPITALNPWNLTQALLSNSPLQAEVMQICYDSDLDDFYYNLVVSAQNGEVNILSLLESDISKHAGDKGEALSKMGRLSWLDSTDVGAAMDYLKQWHDSLPADDGAAVKAGYYNAKKDMPSLFSVAEEEKLTSATPEVWELLKRYAANMEVSNTDTLDEDTKQWLITLAEDRWTIGSAQASAWLQAATGAEPLDEVIVLPGEMDLRSTVQKRIRNRNSHTPILLEAYPNPSDGPVYVVCNVPEGVTTAVLRICDMNGRLIQEMAIQSGTGLAEIRPGTVAAGFYTAELRLDGVRAGQVKLALH